MALERKSKVLKRRYKQPSKTIVLELAFDENNINFIIIFLKKEKESSFQTKQHHRPHTNIKPKWGNKPEENRQREKKKKNDGGDVSRQRRGRRRRGGRGWR